MKKLLFGSILLALVIVFPMPTMAAVDVHVSIPLPPLIVFAAPPEVVVLPETNVYVVPDSDEDIFFYNGWWWRPWEGRWYRSRDYNSGWGYYRNVPSFYRGIPSGWRNDYRDRRWGGHQWNHQRIPHQQVQQNWSNWEKSRHWEKQNTWGVQGLKPRTQSQPKSREAAQPQRSREVQPHPSQPKSREAAQPQQSREVKPQQSHPKSREAAQPQQSRKVKPQQSQPRQGKPEREEGEKNDRK
jgi:hypothetical protein